MPLRIGAAAGLLTLAGAGVAVASELRHRRAFAADPQWDLLRAPVSGEPVTALSADGTELHVEVFGEPSAPTFVLIPGWTEELQIFDLLTRGLLGRGYRVVSYDPRGQGSSGGGRGLDQSIERYAEDLTAVLSTTCAGRDDVIVAGHSMGGMTLVAWAATVDVDDHLRAVALISTGVSGLVDDLGLLPSTIPLETRRRILTPLLAGDQPMIAYSTPLSRAINRYVMFGPDATAAHMAFVEPMIWRMHGKLRAAAAVTMRELDLAAALERINVPALVVVGDSDRLTPPVHARRMVSGLPQVAEFVQLKRTGHMTPVERPVELQAALIDLADSVGLPAPRDEAATEPQPV
ncbi:MAG TPA: alpha/beta hydrolase [Solirubrobacteraceae bacterium]|nr:alpha/beta hydrolase [Solirubrobacteraceae bacterium]